MKDWKITEVQGTDADLRCCLQLIEEEMHGTVFTILSKGERMQGQLRIEVWSVVYYVED